MDLNREGARSVDDLKPALSYRDIVQEVKRTTHRFGGGVQRQWGICNGKGCGGKRMDRRGLCCL